MHHQGLEGTQRHLPCSKDSTPSMRPDNGFCRELSSRPFRLREVRQFCSTAYKGFVRRMFQSNILREDAVHYIQEGIVRLAVFLSFCPPLLQRPEMTGFSLTDVLSRGSVEELQDPAVPCSLRNDVLHTLGQRPVVPFLGACMRTVHEGRGRSAICSDMMPRCPGSNTAPCARWDMDFNQNMPALYQNNL
jgi:hypothetical protein